jgi:uncharacterized protein (TIGR02246 family)
MRSYIISIVLALTLALAACQPAPQKEVAPAPPSQADIEAAIGKVRAAYVAAENAGDAAALAALFTDDAVLMPPDAPAASGKEAIQSYFQSRNDEFTFELAVTKAEVVAAGDWAFSRGTYTLKATPKPKGKTIEDSGKYLNILAHQPDGSWKIARHIWNSDNPLAGAAKKK